MNGKVYVVNEPARYTPDDSGKFERYANRPLATAGVGVPLMDLRPAEEFGQLTYLLPAGRVPTDPSLLASTLEAGLGSFDPERDFLLPVGDMTACITAAAILSYGLDGFFRVLRWNRKTKRYGMVEIDVGKPPAPAQVTRK